MTLSPEILALYFIVVFLIFPPPPTPSACQVYALVFPSCIFAVWVLCLLSKWRKYSWTCHPKSPQVSRFGVCWRDQWAQWLLVLPSLSGHIYPCGYFSGSCSFSSPGMLNLALKSLCMGARAPVCLGMFQVLNQKLYYCILSWFCFFPDLWCLFCECVLKDAYIYPRQKPWCL